MADFKKKQRVKRADGSGCLGTVVEIQDESDKGSEHNEKGVLISVQWDNGTYSYFTPEGITLAEGSQA